MLAEGGSTGPVSARFWELKGAPAARPTCWGGTSAWPKKEWFAGRQRACPCLPSEHPVGGVAGRRGDLVRLQVAAAEGGDELEAEDVDVDGR